MVNNNSFEVGELCLEIVSKWVGGCQSDCDDCKDGKGGSDNCYIFFCFLMDYIKNVDMKKKLDYQRARHNEPRRVVSRIERDVTAWCSNCKYSETVSLVNDKLVPSKKFRQDTEGFIYHKCSEDRLSLCKLR